MVAISSTFEKQLQVLTLSESVRNFKNQLFENNLEFHYPSLFRFGFFWDAIEKHQVSRHTVLITNDLQLVKKAGDGNVKKLKIVKLMMQ